jgi:hypothetical protein
MRQTAWDSCGSDEVIYILVVGWRHAKIQEGEGGFRVLLVLAPSLAPKTRSSLGVEESWV